MRRRRVSPVARVTGAVREWNRRMLETAEDGTRRGTRWGRGACAFVPSMTAIGGLGVEVASGALAVNLSVTNSQFQLYSNAVYNTSGFGAALVNQTVSGGTGTPMARVGFAKASLNGFCAIVTQNFGTSAVPVNVELVLKGGDQVLPSITSATPTFTGTPPAVTTPISANDLFFQTTGLRALGTTNLANAVLGQSADTVTVDGNPLGTQTSSGPGLAPVTAGAFGISAATGGAAGAKVDLAGLNATAYDADIVGQLTLPNLTVNVYTGTPPASPC
ncbi:MAG: cholesterol esterase [Catenulispora sp.]|nr:cholesterol esterase [Catenulispora sp.]